MAPLWMSRYHCESVPFSSPESVPVKKDWAMVSKRREMLENVMNWICVLLNFCVEPELSRATFGEKALEGDEG